MKLIVAFVFILAVSANKFEFSAEIHNKSETRIINGVLAKLGDFPYQVGVTFEKDDELHSCGGSLIHRNIVMTAAHCLYGNSKVELRFGSLQIYEDGVTRESDKFVIHENYDPKTLYNDIGLIYFSENIPISDIINLVQLPKPSDIISEKEDLIVSGYGYTAYGPEDELYYIQVKSISNKNCKQYFNFINDSQLCCQGTKGKSICRGDSGGPLTKLINNIPVQVGIVSFVHKLGCMNHMPFGFTRVTNHLEWIDKNIYNLLSL